MIFLIFFSLLFSFFVVQCFRYKNPYKLHYLFGKKGAGKSLYLVKMMLKYKRRGWHVYTDMMDVNIPDVRLISSSDLANFRPEPHSALFLDEVGITYDNRKFKTLPDGIRDFYKFLRKMECTCYMCSQSYDVDKKIRDTVDDMALLMSLGGVVGLYRPIKRQITLVEPTAEGEARIADRLRFKSIFSWKFTYFPKYMKYFDTKSMPERELLPYESVTGAVTQSDTKGFRGVFGFFRDFGKVLRGYFRTFRKH